MTNALSCYVRDKLPPCSLFLLILKIVLTFFPLPMNHWIELRGRRLIRAVHYWKYRLFFRKGKKVSLSFETGRGENAVWLSWVVMLHHKEKATVSLQSYETNRTVNVSSLGKEINRVYRQSYIAWLIARGRIFITIYKMYTFTLILFELLSLWINYNLRYPYLYVRRLTVES